LYTNAALTPDTTRISNPLLGQAQTSFDLMDVRSAVTSAALTPTDTAIDVDNAALLVSYQVRELEELAYILSFFAHPRNRIIRVISLQRSHPRCA
jgi:hypothetical protein